MSQPDPEKNCEIVIVRRRGGDDHDEHHGGVWKVAFADFMTALMAFFLVLWIVNSTTKQTRSSLARYFNPIRLSDTTPARKGLNDPREVDFDASADGALRQDAPPEKQKAAEVRDDPGAAVAQAIRRNAQENETASGQIKEAEKTQGNEEFSDPFAQKKSRQNDAEKSEKAQIPVKSAPGHAEEAKALKAEIETKFGNELNATIKGAFDVVETPEGALISLTDRADLGTFAVGSSEPEQRLLRALAAIADTLRTKTGSIVVRGHTDARPYRGGKSDNWRLSFERAQRAFSGLVEAGFDERRVERVEGYADHKLRNAAAPEAPENRRIEILLRWTGN
ncbi:MAG: flagellar motor protein MotB [Rhodoblastus sp.]